ncbi:type II secretion system secretin GspD [Lysobacter brunescens]|uniref:Type II secretion system secretin GspD n=1 Tax=Lysobacter brunescens TaxID=262323 RepID=A0ABW2YDU4_9GAMM
MNLQAAARTTFAAALCAIFAAHAASPTPVIKRNARQSAPSTAADAPAPAPAATPESEEDARAKAVIHRGNGQVINRDAAGSPLPDLDATSGEATFNFEGESLHAVVKAILGDMLGQNYTIAPNVQGTVTYVTPKKISPAQALSVLEMILGWNNARMIYSDGRYSIVPADQALATGVVAPRSNPPASARGFESRVVPLRYISASEMEKLLKPYARPGAIVTVDPGRNLMTLAGSRAELESYLRTIEVFDVDWMASMSVGVFPLESSRASKVVQDLEKVFGEGSKSPVAGMFRFMPIESANAVLAITAQPEYLDDIQQWIERIDGAGEGLRLYSYELKYITAKDLAARLGEVFGGSGGGSGGNDGGGGISLIPGGQSTTISAGGAGASKDGGMDGGGGPGGSGGGLGSGSLSLGGGNQGGSGSVVIEVGGDKVAVSAIEENNTLLVRSTPSAWRSIMDVIEKLDMLPLQVHIESQVVEVKLTGELAYGVNWFIENAAQENGLPDVTDPLGSIPRKWSTLGASLGGKGTGGGLAWTLLKNDAAAIITALDKVTDVRLLQTGSLLARNNAEATLNVGSRIPVTSVSVNPIIGNNNSISQVQYLDTGVILKVRPRVTKDGTVFLDIVQEVSSPGSAADANGNVRIDTRRLKTEAIVPTGDTVMLAGLVQDGSSKGSTGIPGLSRIPWVGGLFGRQTTSKDRTEVVVLITPTIIRDQQELRDFTDDYTRGFRAMEPIKSSKKPRRAASGG